MEAYSYCISFEYVMVSSLLTTKIIGAVFKKIGFRMTSRGDDDDNIILPKKNKKGDYCFTYLPDKLIWK